MLDNRVPASIVAAFLERGDWGTLLECNDDAQRVHDKQTGHDNLQNVLRKSTLARSSLQLKCNGGLARASAHCTE